MESLEGEIIYRISKNLHLLPTDVIKMKRTVNGRFLWRREFIGIKAEIEAYEEQQEKLAEMESR